MYSKTSSNLLLTTPEDVSRTYSHYSSKYMTYFFFFQFSCTIAQKMSFLCVQPCRWLAPPLGQWQLYRVICPLLFMLGVFIFVLEISDQNGFLSWCLSVTGTMLLLHLPAGSLGGMKVFTLFAPLWKTPKLFLNFLHKCISNVPFKKVPHYWENPTGIS